MFREEVHFFGKSVQICAQITNCTSKKLYSRRSALLPGRLIQILVFGTTIYSSSPDPGDARVWLTVGGDVEVELVEGLRGADAVLVLREEPRFHGGVHLVVLAQQHSPMTFCDGKLLKV